MVESSRMVIRLVLLLILLILMTKVKFLINGSIFPRMMFKHRSLMVLHLRN
nr:MAG TPA: hypothetical protein [Caudoviricetes sp.]